MVTLNVFTSHHGVDHRWDADLIGRIYQDGDRKPVMSCDANYVSFPGVRLDVVSSGISEMLDIVGAELLLIGRSFMVDQMLNEFATARTPDVEFSLAGTGLENVAWWRGCLIVRMLNWHNPYADFPANEMWLMPLGPARNGEVTTMIRYVDTTLAP